MKDSEGQQTVSEHFSHAKISSAISEIVSGKPDLNSAIIIILIFHIIVCG